MSHLFEQLEKEEALNQLKIDLLSRFYPFTNDEIIQYAPILNFGYNHLMANNTVNWDIEMIEIWKDKMDWDGLWKIKNITIDYNFIKKYEDRINFNNLPDCKSVSWTLEIVDEYEDKFDWSGSISSISLFNNYDILKKYSDKLDWDKVSLHNYLLSSEEFINEYENKLNWRKISANKNIPISPEFILKYSDKLDINLISRLPFSVDFIYRYPIDIKWNWDMVIVNPGINYDDQTFKFIFENYKKYYQSKVFSNPLFKEFALHIFLTRIFNLYLNDKTYFLKEDFINLINWNHIVGYCNTKLPLEFITANKSKFNFKNSEFIRDHKNILTQSFIEDNLDLFDTNHYTFYYLPITLEILRKLDEKVNWHKLSSCTKLDWTWELIETNWLKLNNHELSQNLGVYDKLLSNRLNKTEIFSILD